MLGRPFRIGCSRTAIGAALCMAFVALGCTGANDENVGETTEAYTADCPDAGTVEGVDIYDGQGVIDWSKVRSGPPTDGGADAGKGKEFAFIKATQGNYNEQSKFDSNWTNAKAAGVLRSAYHFFDPTIDGKEQANYFLAKIGADLGELPPMLDIECPTDGVEANASANCEYTGNSGWAPPATIQSRIFDFLDTVEAATGKKAILYSYPSWFAAVSVTDPKLAKYPLYIASLNTCAQVPAPWTSAVFWQYSFTGTVYGISGDCDLDRFIGDRAHLDSFAFGEPDSGPDASKPIVDAGNYVDSGADAGIQITASAEADEGCGCETVGSRESESSAAILFIGAIALAAVRRKKRS